MSLSGSFLPWESSGQRSRTGGLSVLLAGPDGRVLGGVAVLLTAASSVQVLLSSGLHYFICAESNSVVQALRFQKLILFISSLFLFLFLSILKIFIFDSLTTIYGTCILMQWCICRLLLVVLFRKIGKNQVWGLTNLKPCMLQAHQ